MNKDDMILISVDDHIVEPPDMFKNHLPRSTWTRRRGWCTTPMVSDTWQFRDMVIPNVALNAVAGGRRRSTAWSPRASMRSGRGATRSTSGSRT